MLLSNAAIAEIRKRAEARYRTESPIAERDDVDALLADRAELARRLATIEAAAQVFFTSDSWCAGLRDHVSAKACPCGYAQLRSAFAGAAPMEDTP